MERRRRTEDGRPKKRLILSVTNDVITDQRVGRMARTLHEMGFDVVIVGIRRNNSLPFTPVYAKVVRMPLFFQRSFLFYAEYNIRLFFLLLFKPCRLLVSNDLDTLPANQLVAWIRCKPLMFDAHEYYTGTPEVAGRPFVYRFWKALERFLLPRQKTLITVNDSLAALYRQEYGIKAHVIRNLPPYRPLQGAIPRDELSLPPHLDIVLLQGAGINIDRGAEELVMSMHPRYGIPAALLLIIGDGDVLPSLKEMVKQHGLANRVWFLQKMPYEQLCEYTRQASIGASLDKDTNLNYRYSLPNKLFDYIMAGTPQLVSDLPEPRRVIQKYDTGLIVQGHDPAQIADAIKRMLADRVRLKTWETNSLTAARELCWENEEKLLRPIYADFLK